MNVRLASAVLLSPSGIGFFLIAAFLLAGCSSVQMRRWVPTVQPTPNELIGATKEQVLRRLGPPGRVESRSGKREVWFYHDLWWADEAWSSWELYFDWEGRLRGWELTDPPSAQGNVRSGFYQRDGTRIID